MGPSDDDVPTIAADTIDTRKKKRRKRKQGGVDALFQETLAAAHRIGD